MQSACSLPYAQEPTTFTYRESDSISLTHFNIAVPSAPRSSKLSLPFHLPTKPSVHSALFSTLLALQYSAFAINNGTSVWFRTASCPTFYLGVHFIVIA